MPDLLEAHARWLAEQSAVGGPVEGGGGCDPGTEPPVEPAIFPIGFATSPDRPRPRSARKRWSAIWKRRRAARPLTSRRARRAPAGRDLRGADLRWARLWHLEGADLTRADLRCALFERANLEGARLVEARLEGADLADAEFYWVDLRRASVDAATILPPKWQRVWEWVNHPERHPDLSGADLAGVALTDQTVPEADLHHANLWQAKIADAALPGADLREAGLDQARLRNVDLAAARLTGASLRSASLDDVDLTGAELSETDLRGARLRGLELRDATLRRARLGGARISLRDTTMRLDLSERAASSSGALRPRGRTSPARISRGHGSSETSGGPSFARPTCAEHASRSSSTRQTCGRPTCAKSARDPPADLLCAAPTCARCEAAACTSRRSPSREPI